MCPHQIHEVAEPDWDECLELLSEFPALPAAERPAAIERLVRSQRPGIRERALRMGAAVLRDETLVRFLRDDADAALRNAALEILKLRGKASFSLAASLLDDREPDVVLQGILVLDHIGNPRAVEPLRSVLHHPDSNIVQAAIVAIGHVGDARTIPDLLPLLESDTWLQVAAIQALGDLRSPRAIAPLEALLADPIAGPLAAEAMAQIGGPEALAPLADHWLDHQDELDPETALGLLAHVLEGLEDTPEPSEELRRSLAARLRDPFRGVRESAARCLLALGPGPEDGEALSLLGGAARDPEVLPRCLARRHDLIGALLEKSGVFRSWGFLLSSRYPEAAASAPLERALADPHRPETLKPIVDALARLRGAALARPLLNLYLDLPVDSRAEMLPVLELHRTGIQAELAERSDVAASDRIILAAALGADADSVARQAAALPEPDRLAALSQLGDYPEVMRALPWSDWLAARPATYLGLAARAAIASELDDLLPLLRPHLATDPTPELVRAVGERRDQASITALLGLAERDDLPHLRPLIFAALGQIGGADARRVLRAAALSTDEKEARLGFKILAACATDDDLELFREAATHQDWLVRLAAVEVLERTADGADLATLSALAADPVAVVAQRAITALEDGPQ